MVILTSFHITINHSVSDDPLAIKPEPGQFEVVEAIKPEPDLFEVVKEEPEDLLLVTDFKPELSPPPDESPTESRAASPAWSPAESPADSPSDSCSDDQRGKRRDGRSCTASRSVTGRKIIKSESPSASVDAEACSPREASQSPENAAERPKRRRRKRSPKSFPCPSCDQVFKCRSWLEKHRRTHTGEQPFNCKYCGQTFTQLSSRNKHVRHKHFGGPKPWLSNGKPEPVRCDVCDKVFATKSYLRAHQATHSGEMTVACKLCDKTFPHIIKLNAHMRCHSGRFRCEKCGDSFPCKSKLDRHIFRRHSDGGPTKCDICSKEFTSRGGLNKHMGIVHATSPKPFACGTCGRSFTTKRFLAVHIATHTKDQEVSCDICGKTFSHPRSLYMHKKAHRPQGKTS
ncbi:gastrula zinc finger protein XlCGF28.1-like [Amphibalanus amphitrite]|uniref:gastrula zinc finger protein XlCGF28.1-like n=1 Tax=Amphibalanus amphitrite TaxID=1232801 RepID=UPI001C929837|nr:gastrula zinc finger protein XlCGF28.1-like [Amphibalanus amphitrite]